MVFRKGCKSLNIGEKDRYFAAFPAELCKFRIFNELIDYLFSNVA